MPARRKQVLLYGELKKDSLFPDPFYVYVIFTSDAPKSLGSKINGVATIVSFTVGAPEPANWHFLGSSVEDAENEAISALKALASDHGLRTDLDDG